MLQALNEAWNWLEKEGILIHRILGLYAISGRASNLTEGLMGPSGIKTEPLPEMPSDLADYFRETEA